MSNSIFEKDVEEFVTNALQNGFCFVVENPKNSAEIIAEIHCSKHFPAAFKHTIGNLTIVVDQDFHGQGVGKKLFSYLLQEIEKNHSEILRVELMTRSSNKAGQRLYESLGFKFEGVMKNRILNSEGQLEDDLMMAWMNPNFVRN
jgi:putative acetyltransferase